MLNHTILNLNDEYISNSLYFFIFYFSYILYTIIKQVGDRVVALPEFRAWAELCAVPTKYVYKIPDDLSFQDAAAMTMNYLVAYVIVYDLLSLRAGKSVLLHSAGGGVVSIFDLVQCPLMMYVSHILTREFCTLKIDFGREKLAWLFLLCNWNNRLTVSTRKSALVVEVALFMTR
jgi:hypothetical protein